MEVFHFKLCRMYAYLNSFWCGGYFFPKVFIVVWNLICTDFVKVSMGALMEFLDLCN